MRRMRFPRAAGGPASELPGRESDPRPCSGMEKDETMLD